MASEELIRQAMVIMSAWSKANREQILSALLAYEVSRNVEGTQLVMDPKFAEMLGPVMNDQTSREAAIEALLRLEKNEKQRSGTDDGARPTELSVVLLADTSTPLDESTVAMHVAHVLGQKYGAEADPKIRECQFAWISDLEPGVRLTEDVAQAYYSRLQDNPQAKDFGVPTDGWSGTGLDGTPIAALFFWHASEGGKKKKRGLFKRR